MPGSFLLIFFLAISSVCFAQSQKAVYFQNRSEDFLSLRKYKQAEQFADSVLRLSLNTHKRDSIISAYMWLYEIHTTAGNYERAIEDYRLAETFRDSIASEKRDSVEAALKLRLGQEIKARAEETSALEKKVRDTLASSAIERRNGYLILSSFFVIGMIAVIALIRRNDRMQKTINQQLEDQKHLQSFKEKLFSVLSYDLKNSLSAFENLTQGLGKENASIKKEDMTQLLSNLHQTAIDLRTTLANVINWVGYQANSKPFNPETFDSKDLAMKVVEKFEPSMKAKAQVCDVFIPDRQLVYADREMISIVLENLLSNAVHFTRPGGTITCFSGRKDGLVTVGVKDTGVGIRPEDLQKLFDVTEDFHSIGSPSHKGSGVGLVLSKELVERNGGRMYVESEVAKGSTFYFTLPEKKN
jgi:two-component system sensor histidine kinase/response regulator